MNKIPAYKIRPGFTVIVAGIRVQVVRMFYRKGKLCFQSLKGIFWEGGTYDLLDAEAPATRAPAMPQASKQTDVQRRGARRTTFDGLVLSDDEEWTEERL